MKRALLAIATSAIGSLLPAQSDPTENVVLNLADDDRVIWLRLSAGGDDRLFRALPGSRLAQFDDGTAHLYIETENLVDDSLKLTFDVDLTGHVAPGSAAPAGSPRLSSDAVNAGIDTSTWSYYTAFTGTITGSDALDGFSADISRRGDALQIGEGANLMDLSVGIASWFNISNVVQGPNAQLQFAGQHGDFNLSLATEVEQQCVENLSASDRVIWLNLDTNAPNTPGSNCVGTTRYWTVLEGASMTEYPDGTARILIAAVSRNDSNLRLSFDVTLSGYVPAGSAAPGGSPRVTNAINNAGIDTNEWRYYTELNGTIRGRAGLDGFEATISRRGEALQIGQGANLKDLSYGFASWFNIQIQSQNPDAMLCFRAARGDFNGSLGDNCECIGGRVASWENYGTGVAGCAGVPDYTLLADPLTGTPLLVHLGNNSQMTMMCTALWSGEPNDLFVDVLGGTILVSLPTVASASFIVPPGGTEFVCEVPASPCAVGLDVYTQMVCVDNCAPMGYSFSRGLKISVGDL